jgi:hypothetical protein
VDRATAEKLRRSRHMLALARQALGATPLLQRSAPQIAGLWRFDGSEKWSLADFSRRVA